MARMTRDEGPAGGAILRRPIGPDPPRTVGARVLLDP